MFDPGDLMVLTNVAVARASVAEVEEALAAVGRARGALDALEAGLVRRAERLAADGQGAGGPDTLCRQQRVARRRADQIGDRAATLAASPGFEAALAAGGVTAGHVDALARAAAQLPDERRPALFERSSELVGEALRLSPEGFERRCRALVRRLDVDEGEGRLDRQKRRSRVERWTDRASGMWCLRAELDPESGAQVAAVLDAHVERIVQTEAAPRDAHTAARALVALAADGGGRVRPELLLVADLETWRSGLDGSSTCEISAGSPVPPETVRRLTCDADVTVAVHDDDGQVWGVGRHRRSATAAQRRALRSMYPGCAFGDCGAPFDRCEIHHVRRWSVGGATELDNLVPLCVRHHHLVHDLGWQLRLEPDRTLVVRRPDGRTHQRVALPSAAVARQRADRRDREVALARRRLADPAPVGPP